MDRVSDAAPPLLHTVPQAARRLNVSRTALYRLMSAGELRSVKVGGSRRIPEAALRDFVAALDGGGSGHHGAR